MRSLESARSSWQELKRYRTLQELKEAIRLDDRSSSIAQAGCRSACWKAFLLFDTLDVTVWQRTLTSSRSAYNALRSHYFRDIDHLDGDDGNYDPLGEDTETVRGPRFTSSQYCVDDG